MLVIGIAGGTGSGKTTVVKQVMRSFSADEVALLSHDSYYYDNGDISLEERRRKNYDRPDAIEFDLMVKHIEALKAGQSIQEPTYSFITCTRLDETVTVHPRQVLIVEGILCLADEQLRNLIDVKVFVDCDSDIRLSRVIRRDMRERGRDVAAVLERYLKTVRPSHLQFVEPTKVYADIIIPQGGKNKIAIDILTHYIKKTLTQNLSNHD
ncbi:MAG: uridine kinase [Prolixibacteraceae bacterium]|nr:uridine kinase [Prolixibacteraceae bacterium]